MATKKAQTKKKTTQKSALASESFEPTKVTFGIAALAAITLIVFAVLLVAQYNNY